MEIWKSSASRTPLRNTAGQCSWCGSAVLWHDTFEGTRVPLMRGEFPTAQVPPRYRWHLNNGVAHLGADPYEYGRCRLKHSTFCPAIPHEDLDDEMLQLVARLRARMEKKIREGTFTPVLAEPRSEAEVEEPDPQTAAPPGGVRHVFHYYGQLRITPGTLPDLRCVATARTTNERCHNSVFAEDEGAWEQVAVPEAQGRQGQMTLTVTGGLMWVWSLSYYQDFRYITRWMKQRCPSHSDVGTLPDALSHELVRFDPVRHGDFVLNSPPQDCGPIGNNDPAPTAPLTPSQTEPARQECAGDGCTNGKTGTPVEGWLCYQCARRIKRRTTTHRKWQQPPSATTATEDAQPPCVDP